MTFWDVHLTLRGPDGKRLSEFVGAFGTDDLSRALEAALVRAHQASGGLQITRHRPNLPGEGRR